MCKQKNQNSNFRIWMVVVGLLFLSLTASAETPADKLISVNFKSAPVETVLNDIQAQSGLNFFYSADLAKTWPKVTIRQTKKPASEVVNQLMQLIGCEYTLKDNIVTITPQKLSGKERTIKGHVLDADGQPLIGVPICIGESRVCTVTDANGYYEFKIPAEKTTLKYSYVGLETAYATIPAGQSTVTKDVTLQSSLQLDDVVVIGYGSLLRKDLTGSVATVNPDELVNAPSTTIDDALAGKAAGVQVTKADGSPGGAVRIRVRGGSSLIGGVDPLYVIDGIPTEITNPYISTAEITNPIETANYGDDASSSISGSFARGLNSLAGLNMYDIESITIMKDASATAIYGSKAANGVIIITTKKGTKNRKPQLNVNYSITASNPIKEKVLNGEQYLSALRSSMETSNANLEDNKELISAATYAGLIESNNSTLAKLAAMGNAETDWLDEVLRTGVMHNIDVSLSGGGDTSRYYTSFSYTNQRGTLIATDFERYTGKVRLDNDITKRFRTYLNVGLSYSKNNLTNGLYGQALGALPILPVYAEDGSYFNFRKMDNIDDGWAAFNDFQNPVALASALNMAKTYELNASLSGEYDIVKDLSFKSTLSLSYTNYNQYNYIPSYVITAGNRYNGIGSRSQSITTGTYWENTLTYKHEFNELHRINAVVGSSWEHHKVEFFSASGAGYPDDLILNNLSSAQVATSIGGASPSTSSALLSFYGRANYTLMDRYLFTFTGRSDTSSKFSKAHRTGVFPSCAFAWRVSEEPFLKGAKWIDEIKLRASMGKTGTQNISDYMFLTLYSPGAYRGRSALYPTQLGNDDIRWESTTQQDAAIDFSFFKNRLGGTFALYKKVTDGALLSVTPAPSSGFSSVISNIAKIRNTGIELELYGEFIRTKDFSWKGALNISHNGSKVLNILDSDLVDSSDGKTINMGTSIIREGESLGLLYGVKTKGIIRTQEQLADYMERYLFWPYDSPDLGIGSIEYDIAEGDAYEHEEVIGNCTPDFYGGYTNTLTYKNWSLTANFTFSYGNDMIYQKDVTDRCFNTLSNRGVSILEASSHNVLTSKPLSTFHSVVYLTDMNVYDASYLKLQTLSLAYNLPQSVLRKLPLQSLQLYTTISNLFTITNYPGPDPSVSDNPYSISGGGRDISSYPTSKSFTFGVRLGF